MNKEEIESKIEEILNKNIVKGTAYTFGTERLKKELVALIQKSNRKAIEDFADFHNEIEKSLPRGLKRYIFTKGYFKERGLNER